MTQKECFKLFEKHFDQIKQEFLAHNIKVSTENDFLQECRRVFGKEKVWVSD